MSCRILAARRQELYGKLKRAEKLSEQMFQNGVGDVAGFTKRSGPARWPMSTISKAHWRPRAARRGIGRLHYGGGTGSDE